jgi:FemAB-related protein (PEP-CTERM system-associated)
VALNVLQACRPEPDPLPPKRNTIYFETPVRTRDSISQPDVDPTPLQVLRLEEVDALRWDEFVMRHPLATPFHLLAWKRTVEESFHFRPMYLLAADDDGIRGVLPLFVVQNPVLGKALISSPFAVYGGILADCEDAVKRLHAGALELGRKLGVDYVEFRNSRVEQCVSGPNVDRYVSFSQPLVGDETALLESLPKKTRNLVRKALKQNFETRNQVADLRNFTALYARNMRRLGTPCFPPQYFTSLVRNFGSMVDVREVWLDRQPLATSLSFLFHGDVHIYYAAADTRYNHLGPNMYMYFDQLRWAGANGFETFDFGRCKRGTGVFDFKRHWNTTMRQLPYEVVLIRRKKLPNFSPTNPKFQIAIRLWRLVPMWLTRLIGPRLVRLFP